jgi:hypothetical protein
MGENVAKGGTGAPRELTSLGFAAERTLSRVLSLTKDRPKVVSKPVLSEVGGGQSRGDCDAIIPQPPLCLRHAHLCDMIW